MHSTQPNQNNSFIIAALPSNLKLATFAGLALVLCGFFGPVARQSLGLIDSTAPINQILAEPTEDPTK